MDNARVNRASVVKTVQSVYRASFHTVELKAVCLDIHTSYRTFCYMDGCDVLQVEWLFMV